MLALCWYWATDGVGSKVCLKIALLCIIISPENLHFINLTVVIIHVCHRIWLFFHTRIVCYCLVGICSSWLWNLSAKSSIWTAIGYRTPYKFFLLFNVLVAVNFFVFLFCMNFDICISLYIVVCSIIEGKHF